MIEKFVSLCLRRRKLVWLIAVLLMIFGYTSWNALEIEAYPDIADVTSQVITQYLGHAAEEVEEQVTIPLERELNGIPGLQVMRSRSTFGLSLITLVFRDGVDDYWARQRIQERIAGVSLPPGANPGLDPLTSPIGEIYRYTLVSDFRDQRELRELQEWVVIPRLKQAPGVADITNFGGETTQFQLVVDPAKLAQYNVSLAQVIAAIQANNANAGGSIVVRGEQGYVVRGIGLIRSLQDLGNIVILAKNGTPVFVKNLGTLQLGALERRGILGKDANPDTVSGIVLLLKGMNPSQVLEGVHAQVNALNNGILPPDTKVMPYLDRTNLVHTTVHRVSQTLLEGMSLVLLVLLLFLGSARGALMVAITVPFSLLFAFICMRFTNIPANLLSLGAIDFGIIVDAAIVVMENILRHREEHPDSPLSEENARQSAIEVARPIFFATLIIITAYLPLFAFQRVEKKLFSPMAYVVGYSLVGALLMALAIIPGLALVTYQKPRKPFHNPVLMWIARAYRQVIHHVIHHPLQAIGPAVIAMILAIVLAINIGKEFLPYLDEGSIWLQVQLPPGLSLQKAASMADELRAATLEFPEVSTVVTQLGRNDDGTDPWTPSHIECFVGLKPYNTWPNHGDKAELIRRMSKRYAKLPGADVGFSQPMIDGVNDKISGAHSDLVVKVFGHEFAETRRIGTELVEVLQAIPGAADVTIDQEPPLPQIQVKVDRAAAARFGINVADIATIIESGIGGKAVSNVFIGERVYDIAVRFPENVRSSADAISSLTVTLPTGARIPLSQVAEITSTTGESTITREMNRRHLTVKLNLRGRDLSSFLAEAHAKIASQVKFDATKYQIEWGGQFENQQRAQKRLAFIIPAVLALIFVLLYSSFGTIRHAALILTIVPVALLGGLIALWFRGMTINVSSAVGFIALFGVAVQNGVIMVASLNHHRQHVPGLHRAVLLGATQRMRPVLMTATVAALGLLPAALARGVGSDVQRPLATVIVGGLVTATLLTLLVLPAMYLLIERRYEKTHPAVPAHWENT
ncbi:MAG TPA: CusA/CzcA family heavy metal efflux RND transporter [Candidatus Sulfotelmatobacter sp.]|nr:CusA/CzcA family heavy metal efflux RND transporter [Candidatus Sulfotelmatobacter sp.]